MKLVVAITLMSVVVVVASLLAVSEPPPQDNYYGSPAPILPMAFAHADHTTVTCVTCHHNFADDTGMGLCLNCHVSDEALWPLLEDQFHDLCRGCHVDLSSQHESGGPARQCLACHHLEENP